MFVSSLSLLASLLLLLLLPTAKFSKFDFELLLAIFVPKATLEMLPLSICASIQESRFKHLVEDCVQLHMPYGSGVWASLV